MINDNHRTDRRPPAGQVRPSARGDNGRAHPPGLEEQRGATATSGDRPNDSQDLRRTIRSPRFWVTLLIALGINWFLAPLLFPQPQDRVTVPYTFFKQQVVAGNVTAITSRGEDIQGTFKQMVSDPTVAAQTPATQSEGVYALDRAGRFTFINPAAEQLLGWTEAELLGRDAHPVIHMQRANGVCIVPEDVPLQAMMHSGTTYSDDDAVLTRRDGAVFPAAYSAAPIVTDGQVVGAVVVFRDMTEVRRLQQSQEEYLALISHDLRAPLTTIMGGTELLLRTLTQQGLEREVVSAKIVFESSHRMNDMIEGLLDRSRLEAGQVAMRQNPIDLVQLATRIIDQTVMPADRNQIHLEGVAELPVVVDAAQIERVIINLLTNALKFSAPGSPVVVGLYRDGNRALVSIADQGGGIDPQDLLHVFEKHYRARTRTEIEGTGLGLYISRLIVEAHGGQLWAESRVGMGSRFTFTLPLTQ
jgi:PAS domain S-box-containing protein